MDNADRQSMTHPTRPPRGLLCAANARHMRMRRALSPLLHVHTARCSARLRRSAMASAAFKPAVVTVGDELVMGEVRRAAHAACCV